MTQTESEQGTSQPPDDPTRDVRPLERTVGDQIKLGNLGEAALVAPGAKNTEEDGDADVGSNDLPEVALVKDDGRRVEVVGEPGVGLLARGVADEVHGPAEELLGKKVPENVDGRVANSLAELLLTLSRDIEAVLVLTLLIHRREALMTSHRNDRIRT